MIKKELSEMTSEELWELFPIFLVKPDARWKDYYREEKELLCGKLKIFPVERISHIGSTAINGIFAKNIVDILIELSADGKIEEAAEELERNGYIIMSRDTDRISLNKGYTKDGFALKDH